MKLGLFFIISIPVVTAIIVLIVFMISYYSAIKGEQTITFKQFQSLYQVAPDKWEIADLFTPYLKYYGEGCGYNVIYMKKYSDLIRLKLLLRAENKRKDNIEYTKIRLELIKQWQIDINECNNEILKMTRKELKDEN